MKLYNPKTDRVVECVLNGAKRKNHSANGNPTWELATSSGSFTTQSDASVGYDIANHVEHRHDSWINQAIRLAVTKSGKVYAWELAE